MMNIFIHALNQYEYSNVMVNVMDELHMLEH